MRYLPRSMLFSAMSLPRPRAASMCAGLVPGDEPQKTQMRVRGTAPLVPFDSELDDMMCLCRVSSLVNQMRVSCLYLCAMSYKNQAWGHVQ